MEKNGILESDGQWNCVDESVDLEHADEEDTEVLKHLCEEIPKHTYVWSMIWDTKTEAKHQGKS